MRRRRIIYVPGKNRKPEPTVHRRELWRCLLNGVRRVDPVAARQMEGEAGCFELAAWNDAYYGEHVSLDRDVPWIDRVIEREGASGEDIAEASAWHRLASQLMYELGDRFHWLVKWIPDRRVKAMVRDTEPYFGNHDGAAERIREPVLDLLRQAGRAGDDVMLIGHSLGSVIAYDAMWLLSRVENEPCSIDLFLTIGSPLGMRYVQKHLLGLSGDSTTYPAGIRRWENVSATGDLISLDKTVRGDFGAMIDLGLVDTIRDHCGRVFNWFHNDEGLNVHRSYGYLVNPVTGGIVADWWTGYQRAAAPVLVAHRGYPSRYPENTLLGFGKALEAGAEHLELDIQLSKDGVPILYHDADTVRISGVGGSLFDLTLEEIRSLDASVQQKFGRTYRGIPVATLDEYCEFMQDWPGVGTFVEIKSESIDHHGLEMTVDRVVRALSPIAGRYTIISFHYGCVEYARKVHGATIGWVLSDWSRESEARARVLMPDFMFVSRRLLPAGSCAVWSGPWRWAVYVVDDAATALGYPARGVGYVETDCIGELISDPAL